MNKIIIPAIGLLFFLASCQKEVSVDLGGSGGNGGGGGGATNGDLLSKITAVGASENYTVEYTYDASKRVIRIVYTGTSSGQNIGNDTRVVRNAAGIITQTIEKNAGVPDSSITIVNYNAASGRYESKIMEITTQGFSAIDSSVFVYDGTGKIVQVDEYLSNPGIGLDPFLAAKTVYTYDAAGNNVTFKILSADPLGGPDEVLAETTIGYDTKVNPLILSAGEAVILGDPSMASPNNPTKYDYTDVANAGASSFLLDFTYTYNTKNKPATSSYTQTPGGGVTNNTYTYK